MLDRRQFLQQVKTSSLLALGATVPGFVATTARAAPAGKDTVLVVVEMTGGNDGLNTVIPYGDDLYHKARPTLRYNQPQVVRLDDYHGLNPGLRSLETLWQKGQLAVVQGVGYPNPDRSHFESMDIWHTADPKRKIGSGWLGRSSAHLQLATAALPAVHVGTDKLPLAFQGATGAVPTIHPSRPFALELELRPVETATIRRFGMPPGGTSTGSLADPHIRARKQLIEGLAQPPAAAKDGGLLQFVHRSAGQTYATLERLRRILDEELRADPYGGRGDGLARDLNLVARLIGAEFGTRLFYVAQGGFDTHANQQQEHAALLQQLAGAVTNFFAQLERTGHAKRVVLMTFSEFGRRVQENGSKGTDHGAASCLFVTGPGVKGGLVGKHPSLADLDSGDLQHHTDFRQVYATLVEDWLGCSAEAILGGRFETVKLLQTS